MCSVNICFLCPALFVLIGYAIVRLVIFVLLQQMPGSCRSQFCQRSDFGLASEALPLACVPVKNHSCIYVRDICRYKTYILKGILIHIYNWQILTVHVGVGARNMQGKCICTICLDFSLHTLSLRACMLFAISYVGITVPAKSQIFFLCRESWHLFRYVWPL